MDLQGTVTPMRRTTVSSYHELHAIGILSRPSSTFPSSSLSSAMPSSAVVITSLVTPDLSSASNVFRSSGTPSTSILYRPHPKFPQAASSLIFRPHCRLLKRSGDASSFDRVLVVACRVHLENSSIAKICWKITTDCVSLFT